MSIASKPLAAAPPVSVSAGSGASGLGRNTRLSGAALVAALLLLWELSARLGWVVSANWPPVSSVCAALWSGLTGGEMGWLLLGTLRRMATGYGLGCAAGVVAGLALGTNRWLRWTVQPVIEILRPIPSPAIIPPLVLFLGVDDALKIFIVALTSFFPAFVNALAGVSNVDEVLLGTARTFRIGWWKTMTQVVLPATLPAIAAGLRTAVGLALIATVVSEMIVGSSGIGSYIVQMQYALKPEAMYAAIICLAAIGYALNRAFLLAESRLLPWVGR